MKKIFLLFSFLCFFAFSSTYGQGIRTEIQLGYGSFDMQDLAYFVKQHARDFDFPVKVVESFPAYYCYRISITKEWPDRWQTALILGKASTGARAHYQDYSGELRIDHLVSSVNFGLTAGRALYTYHNFSLGASAGLNILFSDYNIESYLRVYSQQQDDDFRLVASSLALEPAIRAAYQIKRFSLGLSAGMLFDAGGRLHLPNERQAYLVDKSDRPITINWSGYRTFFTLGYSF